MHKTNVSSVVCMTVDNIFTKWSQLPFFTKCLFTDNPFFLDFYGQLDLVFVCAKGEGGSVYKYFWDAHPEAAI